MSYTALLCELLSDGKATMCDACLCTEATEGIITVITIQKTRAKCRIRTRRLFVGCIVNVAVKP